MLGTFQCRLDLRNYIEFKKADCVFSLLGCYCRRAQWLRGRPSDSRLREPGFESCAAVLISWARFFTHCSSLLSCINEYLAIDSGDYVYEQPFAH